MDEFAELRALLVYESKTLAGVIRQVLAALGLTDLIDARDATEALRLAQSTEPDVVILDALADGGDGFSLVRAFRDKSRSPNPYMPIIVASGHGEEAFIRAAVNAGVHEYVRLPLSAKALAERLYSAVFIGRPIIDCPSYFGPERRRHVDPSYAGTERRAGDAEEMAQRLAARAEAERKFSTRLH